jgi:hypothetical protein
MVLFLLHLRHIERVTTREVPVDRSAALQIQFKLNKITFPSLFSIFRQFVPFFVVLATAELDMLHELQQQ